MTNGNKCGDCHWFSQYGFHCANPEKMRYGPGYLHGLEEAAWTDKPACRLFRRVKLVYSASSWTTDGYLPDRSW